MTSKSRNKPKRQKPGRPQKKQKRRPPASIIHHVKHLDIEIEDKKGKKRLLRVQRYKTPVMIRDTILEKNPEKVTILRSYDGRGSLLEVFFYKNNPKYFFFSINGQLHRSNRWKWGEIQSALFKCGKFLGLLK